jgi:dTDP-4-dehydrorhamnose 3,5-epimerase
LQIRKKNTTFAQYFVKIMQIFKTPIEGLLVIEPKVFHDARGYFVETYNEQRYREAGVDAVFVQDNKSSSTYGVVRGLHFQRPPYTQAKLVSCAEGRVLDVAVDLRKDSPTYGQHFAVELDADSQRQFYIPRGFAHGFSVLSERAVFTYKCDNLYHPEADGGILLTDTALGIDWRVPADQMILSEKDKKHPTLNELDNPF